MQIPINAFKRALQAGDTQIGLWAALADAYSTELLASADFDWLLIDAEHAPNDVRSILGQLQAVSGYRTHPVVRPVRSDTAIIKQYLDIGAQSLLLPMIDTEDQAIEAVAATRYPPNGIRGVGSGLARASRWNGVPDYLQTASSQICVLLQIESQTALKNLDAISSVDGVDGVFFGPSDLSASMGYLGQPSASAVQDAILTGIGKVKAAGKAAGVLATDRVIAQRYLSAGAQFVAVGTDIGLLGKAATELARGYRGEPTTPSPSNGGY